MTSRGSPSPSQNSPSPSAARLGLIVRKMSAAVAPDEADLRDALKAAGLPQHYAQKLNEVGFASVASLRAFARNGGAGRSRNSSFELLDDLLGSLKLAPDHRQKFDALLWLEEAV